MTGVSEGRLKLSEVIDVVVSTAQSHQRAFVIEVGMKTDKQTWRSLTGKHPHLTERVEETSTF